MRSRILKSVMARAQKLTQKSSTTPTTVSPTFTQNFFTTPHQSFLDTNGEPLAGGLLYVYEAGTTTPVDTWQDSALTQLNTNPVILDSGGFATVWLDPTQTYKFRMTNSVGVQQWTVDQYQGGSLTANILVPINYLLSASGANDISNGNFTQAWRWTLGGTTPADGLFISEGAVSTNTGLNSALVGIGTRAGSTVAPFRAIAHSGPGLMVNSAGDIIAVNGANVITNISGVANQCVQADINGRLFGTGVPCGSGGGTGGGGGLMSINADTTPAQRIVGSGSVIVSTTGGVTTIYVAPSGAAQLMSLTLNPTTVLGGNTSTGTVTLTAPVAQSGGIVIALSSDTPNEAQVPGSVIVPAGATSATFTVTTAVNVGAPNTPVIKASYAGVTLASELIVVSTLIQSITLNPSTVVGGSTFNYTVTLTGPAPPGGATVSLVQSNTNVVHITNSVFIAAGATSVTLAGSTSTVTSNTVVQIEGEYENTVVTTNLNVTAAGTVQAIYGGVGQPGATSTVTPGSGNTVVLSTGDSLAMVKTTPEVVGDFWSFSPNNQSIYLLLFGGSHTFIDANTGLSFAFNAPKAVTLSGVAMFLYQSTNPLIGTYKPKVAT